MVKDRNGFSSGGKAFRSNVSKAPPLETLSLFTS
jgi:hypothetical protein